MKQQRYNKRKGERTRECSKCHGDLGDRHGKQRYCKKCHAAFMRDTRPKHSELPEFARMKANARCYANEYQRRGKIKKENCKKCGSPDSQKHHSDYSKPLQVEWYCRKCHLELHKNEASCNILCVE